MMNEILIVDDEDRIRRLLKLYLERESFTIHEASDGREAYELAMENDYACILLDLMLLKWMVLKCHQNYVSIKIRLLLCLQLKAKKLIVWKDSNRADDYIVKPFSPEKSY